MYTANSKVINIAQLEWFKKQIIVNMEMIVFSKFFTRTKHFWLLMWMNKNQLEIYNNTFGIIEKVYFRTVSQETKINK